MAHDLDITDGQASFASARVDAWHRLGTITTGAMAATEALEIARLAGWNVRKTPLYAWDEETASRVPVAGRYGIIRTNPVHGRPQALAAGVGEAYKIIQNEQHVGLLDALADESGAHFETAGALDGGRRVFVTMKLPSHMMVGGVDRVDNYIAALNGHDGNTSFSFLVTPVRIVCQNTLNVALGSATNIFRVKHTMGADRILVRQAREVLGLTFKYLEEFEIEAEQMINTTLTQSRFEEIISKEFGAPEDADRRTVTRSENKIEQMLDLFAEANTQAGIRGTAWAGFNALTEYADHYAPTRGEDRDSARAAKAILLPRTKQRARDLMLAV